MEFSIKSGVIEKQRSACLVLPVFEPRRLSHITETLDDITGKYISTLLRRGDLEGKVGQTLLLHHIPNILADRLLLVGCGKERSITDEEYREILKIAVNKLSETGAMEAHSYLTDLNVRGRDLYWNVRFAAEVSYQHFYSFDHFKTNKEVERRSLRRLSFNVINRRDLAMAERGLRHGNAIAIATKDCQNMANMPPNIATPLYLAEEALKLAEQYDKIKVTTFNEAAMYDLKMNAYLAVGSGSKNESMMTIIEYNGRPESPELKAKEFVNLHSKGKIKKNAGLKPIVLVGKGLTFDSGGISLKASAGMDEMKYDKCGATAIYGVMKAVAELELPIDVIGVMACAENMPDGHSYRPGDILTSMSGQTIEVLNTDAEGRLVLADVLTYVERFDPDVVIDVATLTGACVVGLGHHVSGLFSNGTLLAQELLSAADESCDWLWRLPISRDYQRQITSSIADITNTGGSREGGAITAACFLSRFARNYQWAHIDIAGTAWKSGQKKGATGRAVPLLLQFLLNRAYSKKIYVKSGEFRSFEQFEKE